MTTSDLFDNLPHPNKNVAFTPTRAAGLAQLEKFVSRMGDHYTSQRNYDLGAQDRSTASTLSPWIRHRLITEEEVLTRAFARHSPSAASKFVQEVFWRGYFKGWLEHHPSVWQAFKHDLRLAYARIETDQVFKHDYTDSTEGRSGIACFDHWVQELVQTGYLHNHARMWFASIWIFSLRLPWQLGADFFMQHLLDGDPASNTLSWRWVGGLHTKGKTYLACAYNIAKYTGGRFNPEGQIAGLAIALEEPDEHPFVPLPLPSSAPQNTALRLITEEDCYPEIGASQSDSPVLRVFTPVPEQSEKVRAFKQAALPGTEVLSSADWAACIVEAARVSGTREVITAYAPVGPTAAHLAQAKPLLAREGITLHQQMRAYDHLTWPHANKGFFKLKKQIPKILAQLDLKPLA